MKKDSQSTLSKKRIVQFYSRDVSEAVLNEIKDIQKILHGHENYEDAFNVLLSYAQLLKKMHTEDKRIVEILKDLKRNDAEWVALFKVARPSES
jgi:hypothetical protein